MSTNKKNDQKKTPLQELLGFKVSEKVYDALEFDEQIIIDLKLAGWSQDQIAEKIGVPQSTIKVKMQQIRYKLANSVSLASMNFPEKFVNNGKIEGDGS